MRRILFYLSISSLLIYGSGCASVMKLFTIQSGKPNQEQLDTARDVSEHNVTEIASLQKGKQEQIANVANVSTSAIKDLVGSGKKVSPDAYDAISLIAINAMKGIQNANGTAKNLSQLQGGIDKYILRESDIQHLADVAASVPVVMHNQEEAYEGLKKGFHWTGQAIGIAATLAASYFGLGGLANSYRGKASELQTQLGDAQDTIDTKNSVLSSTGKALMTVQEKHPDIWTILLPYLLKEHSTINANGPQELGLTKLV